MAKKQKKNKKESKGKGKGKGKSRSASLASASTASLSGRNVLAVSSSKLSPVDLELLRKFLILQIESKSQAVSYYRNWFNEQSISIKILQQKAFISTKRYHQHLNNLGVDLFVQVNKEPVRPSSSLLVPLRNQVKQLNIQKQQLLGELDKAEVELVELKEKTNRECMETLENEIHRLESALDTEREKYLNDIETIQRKHEEAIAATVEIIQAKKKLAITANINFNEIAPLDTSILKKHHFLKLELDTVTKAMHSNATKVDHLEKMIQDMKETFDTTTLGPSIEITGRTSPLFGRNIKEGGQRFYN